MKKGFVLIPILKVFGRVMALAKRKGDPVKWVSLGLTRSMGF